MPSFDLEARQKKEPHGFTNQLCAVLNNLKPDTGLGASSNKIRAVS